MKSKNKRVATAVAFVALLGFAAPGQAMAEKESEPVPGIDEDKTLSEQLHENKGVIDPPAVGDAEIYVPAPEPEPGTTPIIPPPGTPGGDPAIQPK